MDVKCRTWDVKVDNHRQEAHETAEARLRILGVKGDKGKREAREVGHI